MPPKSTTPSLLESTFPFTSRPVNPAIKNDTWFWQMVREYPQQMELLFAHLLETNVPARFLVQPIQEIFTNVPRFPRIGESINPPGPSQGWLLFFTYHIYCSLYSIGITATQNNERHRLVRAIRLGLDPQNPYIKITYQELGGWKSPSLPIEQLSIKITPDDLLVNPNDKYYPNGVNLLKVAQELGEIFNPFLHSPSLN